MRDRARGQPRRSLRASPATSRSRTGRCCSARSPTASRRSAASAAAATRSRRSPPCARSALAVDEEGDELIVHGVGLRGLQSATIDCGNAGTLARLIVGLLAFQDGTFTLTGDESLSARPMERIAEPLRQMGAQIETTDGHLPLTVTGAKLHGDRLRAAGRERAGQVGHPPRRPRRRGQDDRDRAGADARPHRADAARRGRARDDQAELGQRRRRDEHPARLGRRAGRLLVGGAVHRRRQPRARVADHDPRRQPQPAPHRAARRARPDGRARRDPRARRASAPSRRGRSRCGAPS